MKLDIILRTHDNKNVHLITRAVHASKAEIVLRCARSLAAQKADADVSITVIDDHSSEETVKELKNIFPAATFVALELTGNNASMIEWYTRAKNSTADIVYLVEDDYLHAPGALQEMLDAYQKFSKSTQKPVALFPADDPDNYHPRYSEPAYILPGVKNLWRTNTHTTGTMFLSPSIIRDRWEIIDNFARKYGLVEGLSEETIYRPIWTNEVALFTPLAPLAFHLNEHTHPLFSFKSLWNKYK